MGLVLAAFFETIKDSKKALSMKNSELIFLSQYFDND